MLLYYNNLFIIKHDAEVIQEQVENEINNKRLLKYNNIIVIFEEWLQIMFYNQIFWQLVLLALGICEDWNQIFVWGKILFTNKMFFFLYKI